MVIVDIGKRYAILERKNILARPENILTLQNYMMSMENDSKGKTVPVGIYDYNKIPKAKMELLKKMLIENIHLIMTQIKH